MDEDKKIRTDIFEYNKAFYYFKSAIYQFPKAPFLMQTLFNQLIDAGYLRNGDHPVVVADMCCGAGETVITYLQNVAFQSGLEIRAVDANPEFTGYQGTQMVGPDDMYQPLTSSQVRGVADINLSSAKQSQTIPLKNYQVRHADVLKADLTQALLTKDEIQDNKSPFQLVFLSHCVYYFIGACNDGRQQFVHLLHKISSDYLAQDGIIVLLHRILEPNGYGVIESKFCHKQLQDINLTEDEYNKYSPDAVIRNACQVLGLDCYETYHPSPLHFSQHLSEYADIFKDPSRYNELINNDDALQDLYSMLFLAHRSPDELYQDKSTYGLASLVDTNVNIVKSIGYMKGRVSVQIIPSKKASDVFKHKLKTIVDDINNSDITK